MFSTASFKIQKKNPQRREARQGFLWCTQQDSNLWPFDLQNDFDLYATNEK